MANRTKDDEFSIIHLGDCLWKERSEVHVFSVVQGCLHSLIAHLFSQFSLMCIKVIGAHVCYLVAETNFESYSDSARLCLIGADHIGCPRTYAHPEAIQVSKE